MKLAIALTLLAASCPPSPVTPDAAPLVDATPAPAQEASPGSAACQAACATLERLCKPQSPNCAITLDEHAALIREPDGHALTCADITSAASSAALKALGVACP